jgi:hypothetical protein
MMLGRIRWIEALVAAALLAAVALPGCGESGKKDGTLCSRCSAEDGPCRSEGFIDPLDRGQLDNFCAGQRPDECYICRQETGDENGNSIPGEIICPVALECRRQRESASQRCYPLDPATGSPPRDFACDGEPPRV